MIALTNITTSKNIYKCQNLIRCAVALHSSQIELCCKAHGSLFESLSCSQSAHKERDCKYLISPLYMPKPFKYIPKSFDTLNLKCRDHSNTHPIHNKKKKNKVISCLFKRRKNLNGI